MMIDKKVFFCVYISMHAIHDISALVILPPSSFDDYRRLASLLVGTFDDPTENVVKKSTSLQFKVDALRWNIVEKSLTEEYTRNKYISTARRLRGKKYCVLIAKECIQDDDHNQQVRVRDDVIGIVEMGMSLCPIFSNDAEDSHCTPQPTVGVLCVKSSHQKKGIGQALMKKCEQVAANIWNEQYLFVDVEPSNINAMKLFEKWGYACRVNGMGEAQMRNTTVSRRRIEQSMPHYLLRKRLERNEDVAIMQSYT